MKATLMSFGLVLVGLTHPLLVPVLLIKEDNLKHHFNSGRLIEIKVELLKYLELCFHEHFRHEFDTAFGLAVLSCLLKVQYAIFMHFDRETEANHTYEPLHGRHD